MTDGCEKGRKSTGSEPNEELTSVSKMLIRAHSCSSKYRLVV
jgi:hypothetical protein